MEQADILNILINHYSIQFDALEFIRDSGSVAYTVFSDNHKYFLRAVKPAFFDTAIKSTDIHIFLQEQNFYIGE